jgi:hypothetical protein
MVANLTEDPRGLSTGDRPPAGGYFSFLMVLS